MKIKFLTAMLLLCSVSLFAGNDPKITEVSFDSLRVLKDSVQMDENEYLAKLNDIQAVVKRNVSNIEKAIDAAKDGVKKIVEQQKANLQQRSALKEEDKNLAGKVKILQKERGNIESEQKMLRKDKVITADEKAKKEKALNDRMNANKREFDSVEKRRKSIKSEMGKLDKSDENLIDEKKKEAQRLSSYQLLRDKWTEESKRIKTEISNVKAVIKAKKKLAK